MLNSENRFDDELLIIQQMRRAIELFKAPPYNCRVFNLSLGDDSPCLRANSRQSLWAECLDLLARELKVLLVVSAGNQHLGTGNNARDAEEVLGNYPEYLFEADCGLCDPATAAIAVTVGGIAQHDEPQVRRGRPKRTSSARLRARTSRHPRRGSARGSVRRSSRSSSRTRATGPSMASARRTEPSGMTRGWR